MYYPDLTYIVLVLPAILFSLWASLRVKMTFSKYTKVLSLSGMTGMQAARMILDQNGLYHVRIEPIAGELTDHYDPKSEVVRLSESVYGSTSVAAIGVAAHECGHAIQHATGYVPVKIRSAIVPATNIGSKLSIPLIMIGLIFMSFSEAFIWVAYAGVACFSLCAVFQLVTLPTEYNASNRAMAILKQSGKLESRELKASRKVLSAAALTYVAALAVTLMQLLRLIILVSGSRSRDD